MNLGREYLGVKVPPTKGPLWPKHIIMRYMRYLGRMEIPCVFGGWGDEGGRILERLGFRVYSSGFTW